MELSAPLTEEAGESRQEVASPGSRGGRGGGRSGGPGVMGCPRGPTMGAFHWVSTHTITLCQYGFVK